MLPGASNYNPTAKQVGVCKFSTKGCMIPTALNYNSFATENDNDFPCIEKVEGCTVAATPYSGVASDTPAYRSGYATSSVPEAPATLSGAPSGLVLEVAGVYTGSTVTNYDASANVNSGCIVAIEGCTTP